MSASLILSAALLAGSPISSSEADRTTREILEQRRYRFCEDESGYLMLSMRGFEAVAVRGMQELQAENAALRARLDAIEAKLAAQQ